MPGDRPPWKIICPYRNFPLPPLPILPPLKRIIMPVYSQVKFAKKIETAPVEKHV